MTRRFYTLQLSIYTVAVHRFLQLRKPGYDYEKHFGGAYYLFLRGIEPARPELRDSSDETASGFCRQTQHSVYVMTGEEPFSALDLHFADLIGRLSARRCIELELAALLVSRQRTGGHICLPLHEIAGQPLPAVYRGLELAPEVDDWIEKLQRTDVVGAPGEFKPLILDEQGRLYLRRYWEYEKKLADIIKSRLKTARPAVNTELLRQGLGATFPQQG